MIKNLIIGTAKGYNYYHIVRFIRSLKRTGYHGDVCLFAGHDIGSRTQRALQRDGVHVELFGEKFPFVEKPSDQNTIVSLPHPIHIFNLRHYLYHDYLLKHGHRYGFVMLSDVRDVVFQRDPFDFDVGGNLCCALEDRSRTLAGCPVNSEWLIAGYGGDTLSAIGSRQISCAGTVWGSAEIIMNYSLSILNEVQKLKSATACIDQAIHNYLLHTGQLKSARLLDNDTGPVLTMLYMKHFRLNPEGLLLNSTGEIAHVLHQYDRHAHIRRQIERRLQGSSIDRQVQRILYKVLP